MNVLYIQSEADYGINMCRYQILEEFFDKIYYPSLNYNDPNIYNTLKNIVIENDIDFICGSSIGGLMAFELSARFGIDCICFNPSMEMKSSYKIRKCKIKNRTSLSIIGRYSKIIDPFETANLIKLYDKNSYIRMLGFGDEVPTNIFRLYIEDYMNDTI